MPVEILKTGDANPRNIPVVDVKLNATVNVKPHALQASVLVATELAKNNQLSTDATVAGPKAPIVWNPTKPDKLSVPKLLVATTDQDGAGLPVTFLDPYLILTPKVRMTHSDVILPTDERYADLMDSKQPNWWACNKAYEIYGQAFWFATSGLVNIVDNGDSAAFNTATGDYRYVCCVNSSTWDGDSTHKPKLSYTVQSGFSLTTQTPFVVTLLANKVSNQVRYVLANKLAEYGEAQGLATAYSKSTAAEDGGFALYFGNYCIVYYYKEYKIELYDKQWNRLGVLPIPVSPWASFTVYPIENYLYVFAGVLGATEMTGTQEYIRAEQTTTVNTGGQLQAKFWGPSAMFGVHAMTHRKQATIRTPAITLPYDNPKNYLLLRCAGKDSPTSGNDSVELYLPESTADVAATPRVHIKAEVKDAQQELKDQLKAAEDRAATALDEVTDARLDRDALGPGASPADITAATDKVTNLSARYSAANAAVNSIKSKLKGSKALRYIELTLESNNFIPSTATEYLLNVVEYGLFPKDTNFISPAVSHLQYTVDYDPTPIAMNPNPQIENSDVMSVTIQENTENSSCEIVLNNRMAAPARHSVTHGRYTYPMAGSNFCGVKPITVKLGYQGEQLTGEAKKGAQTATTSGDTTTATDAGLVTKFSGFVVDRQYQRQGSANSTVVLSCQDGSKRLKESFSMMTPIYDGWCHLAVMYDLAKYAGMGDDEILFYQNPVTGKDVKTLRSIMEMDADTNAANKSGGCFDGHFTNDWPRGMTSPKSNKSLPGEYIHAKVSTTPEAKGVAPQWMFAEGTAIWDCMLRVRQSSGWWLFFNSWGNLIYCPPDYYMDASPSITFREMPMGIGDYNEVQDGMSTTQSSAQSRNAVIVISAIPVTEGNYEFAPYMPACMRVVNPQWPNNVADFNYRPWLWYSLHRDPLLADPARLSAYAQQLYQRACRPMQTISFSTWGNPQVYPYQKILFIERSGETGASGENPEAGKEYIVSSVSHTINAEDYTYVTKIDAELYDPSYVFGPLDVKG